MLTIQLTRQTRKGLAVRGKIDFPFEALDYIKTLFNQRKKWYSENELRIQIVDRLETGRS